MVEKNITFILRGYLTCSLVHNVIFNWGIHGPRKNIFERVLKNLKDLEYKFIPIIITCTQEENINRMIKDGRSNERIERAIAIRKLYENLEGHRIDTTCLTTEKTIEEVIKIIEKG